MARNDGNRQRGWVNYFRVLAGVYLLYLAYGLARGIWDRTAENVLLNGAAGAVFAGLGILSYLFRILSSHSAVKSL